jgi:hypothetical protein
MLKSLSWKQLLVALQLVALCGFALPAMSCEKDAGDHMEDAAEDLGDAAENVGDAVKDATH